MSWWSGDHMGELLNGPGHLADTPLPGQSGESVLVGMSATAGAPFRLVADLHAGDVITVRTGQGLFRYVVKGQIAPDLDPRGSGLQARCWYLQRPRATEASAGWRPSGCFVDAELQGKAVKAPSGRPTSVPESDRPGHGQSGAWPFVVGWFLALLVASALSWWLWARWGILRAWLVGAPVVFGVLWFLSNETMRLLPNVV